MSLLIDGPIALFGGLIDYAGVFPPASLSLDEAVAEYRAARSGPYSWMLGRFLARSSSLEALAGLLTTSMVVGERPWSVSVVIDEPPGVGALHAQVFDRHMAPAARVAAVEVRLPGEASDGRNLDAAVAVIGPVVDAVVTISPEVMPFLEVARTEAWSSGIPTAVEALARVRARAMRPLGAKFRTGGAEAAAFPSPEQVARFIVSCRDAGIAYKATAGLHHPMRHHDGELGVMRHGFLNVLVASGIAQTGGSEEEVRHVLEETDATAFQVGAGGVSVSGIRIPIPALRTMRDSLFPAYGSCSFDEPVEDLTALGLIG